MAAIPPDAFAMIIGAMKCGTSSLYAYLSKHPNICPCVTKEPKFFANRPADGYEVGRYEALWDFNPRAHRYALEASTAYTKYPAEPNVVEKIHAYGIRPKFIYLVRNPFERISSHYNFMKNMPEFDRNTSPISGHFINVSNYFLQLAQYRRFFSKQSIYIGDFEQLKKSPHSLYTDICRFLEISQTYAPDVFTIENKTRSLSHAELLIRNSPFGRVWLALPVSLRRVGSGILKKVSMPESTRQLTAQEREIIFDHLKEDMKKFQHEYEVDVKKWGFD